MLLRNDFFTIVEKSAGPDTVRAIILLNEHHRIFDGHFPGAPLVPGVCMIQIILELMEDCVGKPMRLVTADTIKFLAVINPQKNKEVEVSIAYVPDAEKFLLTASLAAGPILFFKLKAIVAHL